MFNYVNEEYRKKHSKIKQINEDMKRDPSKLFFDELWELEDACRNLETAITVKEKSLLLDSVLEEVADCIITFYQMPAIKREEINLEMRFVLDKRKKYKSDELTNIIKYKIDRTLRRFEEGYYEEE